MFRPPGQPKAGERLGRRRPEEAGAGERNEKIAPPDRKTAPEKPSEKKTKRDHLENRDYMTDVLLSIGALLCAILGIVGCIVPVIPGTIFSYAGLLCAYYTSYSQITPLALWVWLAIALFVTLADYILPAWMTKRVGGSRAGAIGATVGVFAGFIILPPFIGLILGPFIGAVAGELLNDKNNFEKALRVGFGSFLSFIVGTGIKLITACGILIHIAADTIPTVKNWAGNLF